MCNKMESIAIRDEVYHRLKHIFGEKLEALYLYGSYARGDYHKDSDIDLFAVVDLTEKELIPYRNDIYSINNELSLTHDVLVSLKIKSKAIFEEFKDTLPFYQNVIKEGLRA